MRLTMKPGVERAWTGVLPQRRLNATMASAVAGSLERPETTSTSFMSGTGLKKCMPTKRPGSRRPAASAVTEIDEVFDASTQSSATTVSRSRKTLFLAAAFSTMASTTRPEPAASSSHGTATMRAATALASAASSLPLAARPSSVEASLATAAAAAPSRASKSLTRWPACAATWAMPAPMMPAPTTKTVVSRPRSRAMSMPEEMKKRCPATAGPANYREVARFVDRRLRLFSKRPHCLTTHARIRPARRQGRLDRQPRRARAGHALCRAQHDLLARAGPLLRLHGVSAGQARQRAGAAPAVAHRRHRAGLRPAARRRRARHQRGRPADRRPGIGPVAGDSEADERQPDPRPRALARLAGLVPRPHGPVRERE